MGDLIIIEDEAGSPKEAFLRAIANIDRQSSKGKKALRQDLSDAWKIYWEGDGAKEEETDG